MGTPIKWRGSPASGAGERAGTRRKGQRGNVGPCVPLEGGFGTRGSNCSPGDTRESRCGLAGEDAVRAPREGERGTGAPSGSSRSRSAAGAASLPPVPGLWSAQDSQFSGWHGMGWDLDSMVSEVFSTQWNGMEGQPLEESERLWVIPAP